MAIPKYTPINDENFWVDGESSFGVKTTLLTNTGSERYWMDGNPAVELYPQGNNDLGRFFIIFEE